ncbi:hypothetical protein Q8F55_000155 [Vanrija albida]|uniref:Uncharacterized protein n=1 Tax=Vanrija albida TaxID=181172 RepID=A0ABR3QCG2_9TREE
MTPVPPHLRNYRGPPPKRKQHPPDDVPFGPYCFKFKKRKRKTLSALAKVEPTFKEVVCAMRELCKTPEMQQRLEITYESRELEVRTRVQDIHSSDHEASLSAFNALMVTFNDLNVKELEIRDTRGCQYPNRCDAVFYRLQNPLRQVRGPHRIVHDLSSSGAPGFHTFEVESLTPSGMGTWILREWLSAIKRNPSLVSFCFRSAMPYRTRCEPRCTCWDEYRFRDGWGEEFNKYDRAKFDEIAALLSSRRQRLKAVHVAVLGIMAFGEVLRSTAAESTPLPVEVVEMVLDFAAGTLLGPKQSKRAQELAFDPTHLGLRERAGALKDLEGVKFDVAMEEWLRGIFTVKASVGTGHEPSVSAFNALMAMFNNLNLTEFTLENNAYTIHPSLYRIRTLRHVRGPVGVISMWVPPPDVPGLHSFELWERLSRGDAYLINHWFPTIERCPSLVVFCIGLHPGGRYPHCSCWDELRWSEEPEEGRWRKIVDKYAAVLSSRRQRLKTAHVAVLGIMAFGEAHRSAPGGPAALPREVAEMVIDVAGTYSFRFKRRKRKMLSSLPKPEPPFEDIVQALRDLTSTTEMVRHTQWGETFEVRVTVRGRTMSDHKLSIDAFEALLATFNSLNITELEIKRTADMSEWRDNPHNAVFYRLRVPLRLLRMTGGNIYFRSLVSSDSPGLHAFELKLKAAHVAVLGILAFGEVVHRSPLNGGPALPREVAEMIIDFASEEATLSHGKVKRAKELAFDPTHLSLRARALKDFKGADEFSPAFEEWLVSEGFVL